MKVIVCGGRDFTNEWLLNEWLDATHSETPITTLVQGGAMGADSLARQWARSRGVLVITVEADWTKHGKAAGPIRNQRMLDEHKPELVIAFNGGRGTADMMRRANAAGVDVQEAIP